MAWTSPKTWNVREKLTAALMNMHLRDNLSYLKSVLEGANADKIPGTAIGNAPTLYRAVLENDGDPAVGAGYTAGTFKNGSVNDNQLRVILRRLAAGTGWVGTLWRLEHNIDNGSAVPAYIEIGTDGGTGGRIFCNGGNQFSVSANTIYLNGLISGSAIYDSGVVYYGPSTYGSLAHGFGVQPRFIAGYSDFGFAGINRPLQGDSNANDPYIYSVDTTYITVATTAAGGANVRVFAIK